MRGHKRIVAPKTERMWGSQHWGECKSLQPHHSPRTLHAEIIKEQNVWKYTLYSISAYCNNETARLREVGCNKEEERNSLDLLMNNMKSSLLCLSFESLNQDQRSGEGHWRHIEREGVIWVSPDITKNWEMMFNTGHCFLRLFRGPSWGSPQFQYRATFCSMVFVNDSFRKWLVCMHARMGPNLHLYLSLTKDENYRNNFSLISCQNKRRSVIGPK